MKKSIALLIAASTLFLAGCCTAHHATTWEYRTVNDDITQVNELANQGWTLAGFSSRTTGAMRAELVYVMKHPKQ
jgi:protein involved in sex pheromone biosynthesis